MNKLPCFLAAFLAVAASAVAQNCTTPPAQRTLSNRAEFGASFYYNIGNHFFDLNAQTNVSISSIKTWTYDSGIGNPPVPNQVGATGVVNFYTCATTRIGNEAISPTAPGTPWTLLGAGVITIVATPGESQIVFATPLALPAGQWGCAVEYLATTNGPNPGLLHCLGVAPNPGLPVSDQFVTMTNDGIQAVSWTGAAAASPNLRITYTPAAASAHYVSIGDGCYFRPHAFYESFPASALAPDLANTAQQWVNVGTNYIIVPSGAAFVPSTSPSLSAGAYGASSSANWDDAISAPFTLPFTFNYPGGSTNDITISSNGCVYLAAVTSNSYDVCGAAYGSVVPFRDQAPRLCAYFHDLDLSVGGSLHYDVDPANQFVRITWTAVPEWPVASALNTMQITLEANGNVTVVIGVVRNTSVGNGNNALWGFTPGLGSRLAPPVDISASMPYTTGDGAIPPVLSMSARPVLGTTPNIVTTNVTPGTIIQILAAGDVLQPVPVDLGFLGMPGCALNVNPFVFLTNIITGNNTFEQPLAIPLNPSLQNVQLVFQGAPLTAGLNAFGIILSNGICVRIGQ